MLFSWRELQKKHIVIGAGMQAFAEEGKKTQPFVSIDLTTMQQRVASPG